MKALSLPSVHGVQPNLLGTALDLRSLRSLQQPLHLLHLQLQGQLWVDRMELLKTVQDSVMQLKMDFTSLNMTYLM